MKRGGLSVFLSEGESVPFSYGFVCYRYDLYKTSEWLPIPLNYIKRLWLKKLQRVQKSDIDLKIIEAQQIAWLKGHDAGRVEAVQDIKKYIREALTNTDKE